MNRRGFIGALLGAAVLDPERLIYVPGRKMISIPAPRVMLMTPETMEHCRNIMDEVVSFHYNRAYMEYLKYGCTMGTGFFRIGDLAA